MGLHLKIRSSALDAVCAYLPSPLDLPPITGSDPDSEAEVTRKPTNDEPFAALLFKIATDHLLAVFRVYSGKLDARSYVFNNRNGKKERISRLMQMHSTNKIQ